MFPELSEVKIRRVNYKISQQELSKRAGVSQSLINKIEAGNSNPSYKLVKKIFMVLDNLEKEREGYFRQQFLAPQFCGRENSIF